MDIKFYWVGASTIEIKKNNESKTFYLTSDTVYNKKIVKEVKGIVIDYLVANLGQVMSEKRGGPLTMSVDMLNNLCKELIIRKVIPIHFDDFSHYENTQEEIIRHGYKVLERGKWISI